MGNGAADIFSAIAATTSSKNGGELAVATILGSGLFVVTVVAGIIATNMKTEAEFNTLGRDIGFYLIAIGSVFQCSA